MKRELERIAAETHDLLVIGGGIQGVAIAREAARRRWRVALVEQEDFGAATSMNSQRMIHGGARYLQTFDFARMRRSALDRRDWMREFPHLVRPVPILVPSFAGAGKPTALVRLGMTLYEILNADRGAGLPASHRIPRHRALSAAAVQAAAPVLEGLPATGAVLFHDALVLDSEQLTLAVAHDAWGEGARLANPAKAVELVREEGRVRGAIVRDEMTGETVRVRAGCTVFAGGPWAARGFETAGGAEAGAAGGAPSTAADPAAPGIPLVRAMALLTRQVDPLHAIAVPSRRASRLLFFTPWRGLTLAGVDEQPFTGDPSSWRVSRPEVERFLEEAAEALPAARLRLDDVRRVFAGLLPVSDEDPAVLAHEDRILEDGDGLVRVVGVKYTTAPSLARRVVEHVAASERGRALAGRTAPAAALPHAAEIDEEEREEIRREAEGGGELILASPRVESADIEFAIRRRMALTLEDIAFRRTSLAMLGLPPDAALGRAARVAGELLGWDEARRDREIASVRGRFSLDAP